VRVRSTDSGLLTLRLILGWIFLWHGLGKLIGPPFPGGGIEGIHAVLAGTGFPIPLVLSWVVVLAETLGGLLLIVGWWTELAAGVLIFEMVVAIASVHFRHGIFGQGGWELNLALCAGLLCLALAGPGAYSLTRRQKTAN
jgi:putative oxidoreductase